MSRRTTALHTKATWHNGNIGSREQWTLRLEPQQIAELRQAADTILAQGGRWQTTTRTDMHLPSWDGLARQLQQELEGGRGFALLSSLPVHELSLEQVRLMLWGIGQHVGYPEPQDAAGNLLHDVRDTGKDLASDNVRAYQTNLPINYHNDGADAFMLLCYRAAHAGGESRLVSAVAVFNEILRRRPDLAAVLQEPFDFDARGQERPGARPFQRVPIYTAHAGLLNVLYKREYIDLAQRWEDVPELTSAQIEVLDLMDVVCNELALSFQMEPGDLVVANNYDILHARAAFQNQTADDDGRHMLRLWLSLPNGRPLPPIFEHTREFFHSYRRRA
ncbi:MAG TPA: taurine catabolism dioxygenase TauD [Candidatus Latescibacteria bacterium]|nr:taurine catabolism dioxygenase TauD [Candidatus Latescibacterota bacterium]|tara:strand:- start:864 stop:1862 length:999 start_codon:yes stop_codon:yes gene_type:complete